MPQRITWAFALIGVIVLAASPALACSASDLGPEIYCGEYRGAVKTSFAKSDDGQLARFDHYDTLAGLLDSLPADSDMRQLGPWRPDGPAARLPEENGNVEVGAYIVAVKPGEDDHDLHVIIGDLQGDFMNAEVSGLPRNHVDEADFARVRSEIRAIVPEVDAEHRGYIRLDPPRPVLLQGSLFFDGDHGAGCSHCPGPAYAKPSTDWEIHPVYNIQPLQVQ